MGAGSFAGGCPSLAKGKKKSGENSWWEDPQNPKDGDKSKGDASK